MKTVIQQISRNLAAKAGIDYEANTFNELRQLLSDVMPVLNFSDGEEVLMPYYSIDDMRCGYFESCISPSFSVEGPTQAIKDLCDIPEIGREEHDFLGVETDNDYDDLKDVTDSNLFMSVRSFNKLSNLFEHVRKYTLDKNCKLLVNYANVFPDEEIETIEYVIENGKISGGGKIVLPEENTYLYLMRLYWLCEAFHNMTLEDLDSMKISIELTRPAEELKYSLFRGGMLIGIQYKYGKTPDIFDTEEQVVSMIKQYPILFNYLPEKWKLNKNILLTFVESNEPYVAGYRTAYEKENTDNHICGSSIIQKRLPELFRNGLPINYSVPDVFRNDADVIKAFENSLMRDCL